MTRRSCSSTRTDSPLCRWTDKVLVWHLYQAAIAGRDIFYDQRYAHNLEMRDRPRSDRHARGATSIPPSRAEIERYTKLFWINTGPVQQPHRAQVRARRARPRRSRRPRTPPNAPAPRFRCGTARRSTRMLRAAGADVLRPPASSRSSRTRRRRRQRHPRRQRQQSVRRRRDDGSRRIRRAASAQLAAGQARRHDSSKRSIASAGATARQIAAIVSHLEAAMPYATAPMAEALGALIRFYETGEDGRPRGVRHRVGAGQGIAGRHDQRLHRGLSRCARHQGRVGSARLLRQPREDARDPEDRRARAVVRRPHAVGSEVPQGRTCTASPPTRSTS